MTEAHIRLENLSKTFTGHSGAAVDGLDLEVRRGEILMLVGSSGCGKTTTLKMINRIIEPTSGRIVIDGVDVTQGDADELRRHIGYVIQQIGLFPHMRISENVSAVLQLLKWPKSRISARVDELLDLVGLDPAIYRDRYPKELSGGQRQRVGVARALAADPPIMLMDEPFGAVDPINRERLQLEFRRLQTTIQKTIVFVTHDIAEALKLGDRIAILGAGAQVVQLGAPAEILAAPRNDFVRGFLGSQLGLKALNLIPLESSMLTDVAATHGRRRLEPLGQAGTPGADHAATTRNGAGAAVAAPVAPLVLGHGHTLTDAIDQIVATGEDHAVVADAHGRYLGRITLSTIHRLAAATAAAPATDDVGASDDVAAV
ncbi:MAG: ABC transporter ATP-binding protein [Pseudonocardiaceae bacterium]